MLAHGNKRVPSAIWAWEGLRRNPAYRRQFFAAQCYQPERIQLHSGGTLLRALRRDKEAEAFGLVSLADPNKKATDAGVFWKPELLAGALRVSLRPVANDRSDEEDHDLIVLSALDIPRTLLDTVDGVRHILLSTERFWVQLYCDRGVPRDEQSTIQIRIDGADHGMRRLDTAAQLLSLHRSSGADLSLIGRRNAPQSVIRALTAFDIYTGFECPRSGLETVARYLVGAERVKKDWGTDRNLKVQARRWVERGQEFVTSGYLDFLTRKSL